MIFYVVTLDLNRHCGVITQPNLMPCYRSITCKSHSAQAKRAVLGRSFPYDVLLEKHGLKGADAEKFSKDKPIGTSAAAPSKKRKTVPADIISSESLPTQEKFIKKLEFKHENIEGPPLYPDQSVNAILYKMKFSAYNNLLVNDKKSYVSSPLHSTFLKIFSVGILPNCLNYRRTPGSSATAGQMSLSNPALHQSSGSSQPHITNSSSKQQKINKKSSKSTRMDSISQVEGDIGQLHGNIISKTSVLNSENFSSMPDLTFA